MSIDSNIDIVIPFGIDPDGVAEVFSDGNMLFGAGRDHDQRSFWFGLIDAIQIYNEAMTQVEITEMVY